jgi:hypothetical protein
MVAGSGFTITSFTAVAAFAEDVGEPDDTIAYVNAAAENEIITGVLSHL